MWQTVFERQNIPLEHFKKRVGRPRYRWINQVYEEAANVMDIEDFDIENLEKRRKVGNAAKEYKFGKQPTIPMPEVQGRHIPRVWTD